MKKVTFGGMAILLALGLWSCADDESAKEPIDQTPPAIPDMPGNSGETAEKPAGDPGTPSEPAAEPNVTAQGQAEKSEGSGADVMYVTSGALNVRSGPGMRFPSVRTLQKGEKVTVSGCQAIWCEIGAKQFVAKTFLSSTP